MSDTLIDPRLEADLAELLAPEARRPWPVRIAAFIAVPAAVALLAGLAALPLLTTSPATRVVIVRTPTPAPAAVTTPAVTPAPTPTPVPAAVVEPTLPPPVEEDGWLTEARSMATAFAVDYLSWSQVPDDQRATALAAYLAPGVPPEAGWRTPGPLVAATPVVTATDIHGPDRATITVAVRITGQQTARWVRLAVPLARDADDQPAVVDLPHLVATPTAGSPTAEPGEHDPALQATVEALVLGAANGTLATVQAQTGFTALDVRIDRVTAGPDPTEATALVSADLRDTVTGVELTQRLTVELHRPDDTWAVRRIR